LVNLHQEGEGFSQVWPVLVAGARAAQADGPRVLVIEQPEAHLHPDAERCLAEWLAGIVRVGVQVILESHSPTLLAAFQLEIATERLAADDFGLIWLREGQDGGPEIFDVRHGPGGEPISGWPPGAFREESKIQVARYRAASRLGPEGQV
jgi:hypothetical protein